MDEFEAEDYDVPLWEWNEIQLWKGLHPMNGEEVFLILELGPTADGPILTPNLQRGLVLGGTVILFSALALGFVISRRLSRPLRELSEAISTMTLQQEAQPLADRFPDGETGEVATAFDGLQKRLQRFADRERRFTRDASHELRTPLTLMRTATQVLRNSIPQPAPKQLRALDHLDQGVDEMSRSVESFLYLARERELHPADSGEEPAALLQALVQAHASDSELPSPELHLEVEGEPTLTVPVELFRIVAGNILRNAILHGGGSPVHLRLTPEHLIIRDQGPGIPDAVRDKLGKPFPEGRNSTGVGLGLSITQEVCDRAGWKVLWGSGPTGGTSVTVTFS